MPFLLEVKTQIAGSHLSNPIGESSNMVPTFYTKLLFAIIATPNTASGYKVDVVRTAVLSSALYAVGPTKIGNKLAADVWV